MGSIKIIQAKVQHRQKGQAVETVVEDAFIASTSPYYLGLALRPSPGLWEFLKSGGKPVVETDAGTFSFRVEFSIDVGENTIFFLSPEEDKD